MDYIYIRAYHNLKGEFPHYTVSVVEQARRQKAPANATHKIGNKWFTMDDVRCRFERAALERMASTWA